MAVHALTLGLVAGLAVAMPLGPVGVLLLKEAVVAGRRRAVAAALGVATVDAVYAVLAVLVGTRLSAVVESHVNLLEVVSGLVLASVGVVGLVGWWRSRGTPVTADESVLRSSRTYLRFVGLTAVNPLTLLVFATVATGAVAGLGDGRPGAGAAVAFVVGVAVASAAWQLLLVLAGGIVGARLDERLRSWVSPIGSLLVIGLATWVLVG